MLTIHRSELDYVKEKHAKEKTKMITRYEKELTFMMATQVKIMDAIKFGGTQLSEARTLIDDIIQDIVQRAKNQEEHVKFVLNQDGTRIEFETMEALHSADFELSQINARLKHWRKWKTMKS